MKYALTASGQVQALTVEQLEDRMISQDTTRYIATASIFDAQRWNVDFLVLQKGFLCSPLYVNHVVKYIQMADPTPN